jgi:hypothetical protein
MMSGDVEPIDGYGRRGRSVPFAYEEDMFKPRFRSLFPDPCYYGDLSSIEGAKPEVQVNTPTALFERLSVEHCRQLPTLHDQWNPSSASIPSLSESELSGEDNSHQERCHSPYRDPHDHIHLRDSPSYQLWPNYGNQPRMDASWIPNQGPAYSYFPHHARRGENEFHTRVYHERQFSPYIGGGQPNVRFQEQTLCSNVGCRGPAYDMCPTQRAPYQDPPSIVGRPSRPPLPSNSLHSSLKEGTQSLALKFKVQTGPKMVEISAGLQVPLRGAEEVGFSCGRFICFFVLVEGSLDSLTCWTLKDTLMFAHFSIGISIFF